jgi:hypothetical protein
MQGVVMNFVLQNLIMEEVRQLTQSNLNCSPFSRRFYPAKYANHSRRILLLRGSVAASEIVVPRTVHAMWFGLQSKQQLLPVLNGIWCEISGYHGGNYEHLCLIGCDAA